MIRRNWTKDELILTFALYLRLPFGKMHHNNIDVINLSKLINRTPGAIAMRLGNFASLDPYHQQRGIKGLTGGTSVCQPIWDEFFENKETLFFESERILAELEHKTIESKFESLLENTKLLKGEAKVREVKTRVNQYVFRQIVLLNYSNKCAITGIQLPELLIASHIIPWSIDDKNRLNPMNGLCLNALHDKAFDSGLIAIRPEDYTIVLSDRLKQKKMINSAFESNFIAYENKSILLPDKFLPQPEFLDWHLKNIFVG